MANERRTVLFRSTISTYENCLCDGCHGEGRVIKLEIPNTKYHNGKNLTTKVNQYWLCRDCRNKLVRALEWGDEDGE